jgi:hypothetical protein
MLTTEGLGHHRILSDARVIERALEFVGAPKSDIRSQLLTEYAL